MPLHMTERAASFIDEARAVRDLPEHYGVRVFSGAKMNGQGMIQIGFSEQPHSGDEVCESEGERLFVDPEISESLGDLVLDVEEEADSIGFVLRLP